MTMSALYALLCSYSVPLLYGLLVPSIKNAPVSPKFFTSYPLPSKLCKRAGYAFGPFFPEFAPVEVYPSVRLSPTHATLIFAAASAVSPSAHAIVPLPRIHPNVSTTLKTIPIAFRISFLTFSTTIFPSFLSILPTYSYRTIYHFVQCVNIIFTPPLHMSYFHHFPYKIHLFLCMMTSFSRADFLTSAYTI